MVSSGCLESEWVRSVWASCLGETVQKPIVRDKDDGTRGHKKGTQ
jgi:hypothetical protein